MRVIFRGAKGRTLPDQGQSSRTWPPQWLDEDKDGVRWNSDVDRPWEWWKHDDEDEVRICNMRRLSKCVCR